jgi:pyridoxamine 5'-phosphate oxidase
MDILSMEKPSLADLRESYTQSGLNVIDMDPDPFTQFKNWMDLAITSGITEPNAMTLATADEYGMPSSRIVLLKHYDEEGFCFFTNYKSRKGTDLAQNPHASIVLHWKELERQVCIRGKVEKTSHEESETYFHMRPHRSQIGALASQQSNRLANRAVLEKREQELLEKYPEGTTVPLPEFWGGYRLIPEYIELWQGRPSRLHDRILYTRGGVSDHWVIRRLCP